MIDRLPPTPASEDVAACDPSVLDARTIAQLRALDTRGTGLLAGVIASYRETARQALDAMAEALRLGDAVTARFMAHRLKGDSASLGAARVAEYARDFEDGAARGELGALHLRLRALEQAFTNALLELGKVEALSLRGTVPSAPRWAPPGELGSRMRSQPCLSVPP